MLLQSISHLLALGFGFFAGTITLASYMLWRMMRSDGWDKSNVTNAERLLSHVVLHPEDFGKMYYLNQDQLDLLGRITIGNSSNLRRPFWYISEDEFQGVVKTRPLR